MLVIATSYNNKELYTCKVLKRLKNDPKQILKEICLQKNLAFDDVDIFIVIEDDEVNHKYIKGTHY